MCGLATDYVHSGFGVDEVGTVMSSVVRVGETEVVGRRAEWTDDEVESRCCIVVVTVDG